MVSVRGFFQIQKKKDLHAKGKWHGGKVNASPNHSIRLVPAPPLPYLKENQAKFFFFSTIFNNKPSFFF